MTGQTDGGWYVRRRGTRPSHEMTQEEMSGAASEAHASTRGCCPASVPRRADLPIVMALWVLKVVGEKKGSAGRGRGAAMQGGAREGRREGQ